MVEEAQDLVAAGAATGAELEPALGQVVEVVDPLGELCRVVDLRQRVEDARPDVDPLGLGGEVAGDDIVGGQVGVLVEEVVLGDPDELEAGLVRGDDRLEVLEDRVVLGLRVGLPAAVGHVVLDEQTELHQDAPFRRLRGPPRDMSRLRRVALYVITLS